MKIGPIVLDCASVPEPDLATIDCIARIQLVARERGSEVRLDNPSPRLLELLGFCGLRVEVERHPEQRE
jgi:hypothetical protein